MNKVCLKILNPNVKCELNVDKSESWYAKEHGTKIPTENIHWSRELHLVWYSVDVPPWAGVHVSYLR